MTGSSGGWSYIVMNIRRPYYNLALIPAIQKVILDFVKQSLPIRVKQVLNSRVKECRCAIVSNLAV